MFDGYFAGVVTSLINTLAMRVAVSVNSEAN